MTRTTRAVVTVGELRSGRAAPEQVAVAADMPATATELAVRLDPPNVTEPPPDTPGPGGSNIHGRCTQYEDDLTYLSPGWDVPTMSRLMYRESRCFPSAANACCTGLLQVHVIWLAQPGCGAWSRADLRDVGKNICVASIIWQAQGYDAWSTW